MDWMDTLRGAAVLAVVVLHVQLTTSAVTGDPLLPLARLDEQLAGVRMPLLMLLSGVLLPRSLAKGLRRHLGGKVRAILWPYAVWTVLDLGHLFADAVIAGRPVPWRLVGEAIYDPTGYLWFLAWLFVFHLAAGLLTERARTIAAVGGLVLAHVVHPASPELARLVWLLPWFLAGDALARTVPTALPPGVSAAANRLGIAPLAAVGRSSIVYYVSHLPVVVYAVPLLWSGLGVHAPWLVCVLALGASLAISATLARVQRAPYWRWLFAWPERAARRSVMEPTVGKGRFPVLRDALSH